MNRHIFFWNIMARIGLLIATAFLLIWLIETQMVEMLFTLIVGIMLLVLQVFLLTRYVAGITRVMEQFIQAIGREETPEIQFGSGKALFQKLKERSNAIKQAMNAQRLEKEKDEQILVHVIDSADPGLFCFNSRGEVIFMNQAARRLIGNREPGQLEDLKGINRKLYVQFKELRSGTPRVVRLARGKEAKDIQKSEQLVSIRLKEVKIFDESYRLFSLQDIQEELHKNESDSWQKIIRVLTHEIMNAVSPMLSLSKSLQQRIKRGGGEDRDKVLDGLNMIENTGKGLLEFVEEYRRLSLLPPPKKKKFKLHAALERILLMFEDEAGDKGIQIGLQMDDPQKEILADAQQFEMIMINLIRNSLDAFTDGQREKSIEIRSQKMDARTHVVVKDNGQGIARELLDQVFVPFFSTKEMGSGIGLSLARQIMNNHEGSIHLESETGLGTEITLVFN
jgi:nitrogen fixation/metabolism regulation signal transduction histidine kinase